MPTIRHPRLVRPSVLSGLKRTSIEALFAPFAGYFASRGAPIDAIANEATPLDALISVLASPVESTPADLIERLELLDLISDSRSALNFEDGYGALVARFREDGDTAADLAVKILLHEPAVAWREFNRQALLAPRSLVSLTVRPGMPFLPPDAGRIGRLRDVLVPWFEANARSGICHVHTREEQGGISFVIRHGDLLKRIGVYDEDGNPASRILRPERVDVAHYRGETGEWRISGLGGKIQELYRQAFGAVFHSSANALAHAKRYSLEPLREGPEALACDPNARVQFARLKSLKVENQSGNHITVSRGDVFHGFNELNPALLRTGLLIEARIDFKIAHRRSLIPVVINPLTDKVSGIHLDDAIEAWLAERHFSNDCRETIVLESA
jgi:hypothetical protein